LGESARSDDRPEPARAAKHLTRRGFLRDTAALSVGGLIPGLPAVAADEPTLHAQARAILQGGPKIALQMSPEPTEKDLQFARQMGVEYVVLWTGGAKANYDYFASRRGRGRRDHRDPSGRPAGGGIGWHPALHLSSFAWTLQEVPFNGVVIPDHIPSMANDPRVGTAYTIGYMQALLQRAQPDGGEGARRGLSMGSVAASPHWRRPFYPLGAQHWSCSQPRFQCQPADTLELLAVVRYQRQTVDERLSGDEQIIGADGLALPLQVGANPGRPLRRRPVERRLDNRGDKALDLLTFPGRAWRLLHAAEQLLHRNHRNGAIGRRELAQGLHQAGALAKHTEAGVGVQQMRHGLQVLHGRKLALLWAPKRGVGNVAGIEKTVRPGLRLRRLKHHRVAVLSDEHRRRQVNALGQADGLAVAFNGHGCGFHGCEPTPPAVGNQAARLPHASVPVSSSPLLSAVLGQDFLDGRSRSAGGGASPLRCQLVQPLSFAGRCDGLGPP